MENNTAKHFVLQLGSLVSLYLSLSFLLVLIFGIINIIFPDVSEGYWEVEGAQSMIRIGIAMTLVFFPTYLLLTRTVNKLRRKETNGKYLSLTKWLIYLSLLVGGLVLLIDLVVVIMTFLEGELSERFVLKAVAVLITIGAAFYYYAKDAKGYWLKHEKQSVLFGVAMAVVAILALVFGVMNIATPTEVREQKIDDTQVTDLQNIQWRIQDYVTLNGTVPESLDDLGNQPELPDAPEGRAPYTYEVTGNGFKLCAEFKAESRNEYYGYSRPMIEEKGIIANPDNWEHGVGEVCFERVVNIE